MGCKRPLYICEKCGAIYDLNPIDWGRPKGRYSKGFEEPHRMTPDDPCMMCGGKLSQKRTEDDSNE